MTHDWNQHGHPPGGEPDARYDDRPRETARDVIYVKQRHILAVWAILAINALIYLYWQVPSPEPPGTAFAREHLLVSYEHLRAGHWWTLVTAAFSHFELWHIALNMMVLFSFGSLLERLWGTRVFIGFYMLAAVTSSLAHCLVSVTVMGKPALPALGASGAVAGLLATFALEFPRRRILFFGIVPVPAFVGVLLFVGFDVWGLIAQGRGGGLPIGHGAHLGGVLTGLLFYFLYRRRSRF